MEAQNKQILNRDEITARLKDIIKPYLGEESLFLSMNDASHLLRDLKVNSAHLVDIVLDVETHFDITIDDEAMERMVTVKDAVDIIESKLAA